MPNRLVRDGFLDSDAVNRLSDAAECLYHRLILSCDDGGRLDGRAEILRARLWPLRESLRVSDVARRLEECIAEGLVLRYEVQGKAYLQVMRWQRTTATRASRYPWVDGSYELTFRTLQTRDGAREYVATSLPEPGADGIEARVAGPAQGVAPASPGRAAVVQTPLRGGADGVAMASSRARYGDGDGDGDGDGGGRARAPTGLDAQTCRGWNAAQYAADLRGLRPEYARLTDTAVLQALSVETDPGYRAQAYCEWRAADMGSLDADRRPGKTLMAYMRNVRRLAGRTAHGAPGAGGTCDPATDTREVV